MIFKVNEEPYRRQGEKSDHNALIILAVYLLFAVAAFWFSGRNWKVFWWTAALTIGLRVVFFYIEYTIDLIIWQLTEGKRLHAACIEFLRRSNFPDPSKVLHFSFVDYLYRMRHPVNQCDDKTQEAAKAEIEDWLLLEANLSHQQRKRYEKTMNKAFLEWFGERWCKVPVTPTGR